MKKKLRDIILIIFSCKPILSYKEIRMNKMGLKPAPEDCDTKYSVNGVN